VIGRYQVYGEQETLKDKTNLRFVVSGSGVPGWNCVLVEIAWERGDEPYLVSGKFSVHSFAILQSLRASDPRLKLIGGNYLIPKP